MQDVESRQSIFSRSKQLLGVKSDLPETIAYSLLDADTSRHQWLPSITNSLSSPEKNACILCGGSRGRKSSAFCRLCYDKIRRTDVILKCRLCEKEFTKQLGEYKKQLKRREDAEFYCSLDCSRAHHAVKNAGKCKGCGNPKKRESLYCSEECKESTRISKKEAKKVLCEQCGKRFRQANSAIRFCSRLCAGKLHSKRMIGTGNPHYKDGNSHSLLFDTMRPAILDRDHHQCVACGDTERLRVLVIQGKARFHSSLAIHHINEIKSDNRAENLVTLCIECHMIHHKSHSTPYPWLGKYAEWASRFMTSKSKDVITSLLAKFSYTTA